ncbi:hypothetical protein Tco_0241591 [Tanacetum coccineum]
MKAAPRTDKRVVRRLKRIAMEFSCCAVGSVAYKLELPQELSRVSHTFNVSILKDMLLDGNHTRSLEGLHIDDKLQFVEEPVEIMEREIKRLKRKPYTTR